MSAPARREWWTAGSSPRPALRIGDADRSGAVEALGEHFATGRLTHEEYDERATRALRARTAADVAPLFADLPAPYPPVLTGRPAPAPAPRPGGRAARAAAAAVPRPPRRLPVLPMLLVLVGLALLLEDAAVLLFGLAVLWWFAAMRWRRARDQWASRWHGAAGPHGWAGPGHRPRC
ncbi:MAG TPA: DUF1707 domain-containing protein [Nocardioides sp.]|nr:DUF1707 domain-containing protein [Nocardioides sp.]